MKRVNLLMTSLFAVSLFFSCSQNELEVPEAEVTQAISTKTQDLTKQSNGAPTGAHYNLNLIGVPKEKTADMTGNNGHRIFVSLFGNTKIKLIEGDDFQVLDANGTDNDGASFQLPNPELSLEDGVYTTAYSVWMRALGKPGGSTTITTCADADLDPEGYVEICSSENIEVTRHKGKSRFEDVSKELLTINILEDFDVYGDGSSIIKAGRYGIFDDEMEDYFWSYDNNGLKLLQLRFYPVPSSFE